MMKPVICEVIEMSDDKRHGAFANAFRVVSEVGPEFLLDFLVYSQTEKRAEVVARVRVHGHMLPAIRDRIGALLTEIQAPQEAPKTAPVLFMAKQDETVN